MSIKTTNNLVFLNSLAVYDQFKYLHDFKNVLKKIKYDKTLESNKHNIILPTKLEVSLLIKFYNEKNNNNLISILMVLFKPVEKKFSFTSPVKYIVVNLNNNTKCIVRYLPIDISILENTSIKYINDNIHKIYESYIVKYNYITPNYMNSVTDWVFDKIDIFSNVLLMNIELITVYDFDVYYYIEGNFEKIDKENTVLVNKNDINDNDNDNDNDNTSFESLNANSRIDTYETFINNLKITNNKEIYINNCLTELKKFCYFNDNIIKHELTKDKINDLFDNKLNDLTVFLIILQPYSLCNSDLFIYNISNEFVLPKKTVFIKKQINLYKFTENSKAYLIIDKIINNVCINQDVNLDSITNVYSPYFNKNVNCVYICLWINIVSYHVEYLINKCKNVQRFETNDINTLTRDIKLFGLRQCKNSDIYKNRINWLFDIFKSNNVNSIPNLIKYCKLIILDIEKCNFLLDMDNTDDDISDLSGT